MNQPSLDWFAELFEAPTPAPAPAPAPAPRVERHFYRCMGCLVIVALDGSRLEMEYSGTVATCAVCGSHYEHMGRVRQDRLVQDRLACKCDDRCTSARGPLCVCHCAGKHHGSGMIGGYHIVTTDAGPVPQITPPGRSLSAARAQYQEYSTLRDQIRQEIDRLLDRRAKEPLPRPEFERMRRLQYLVRAAEKARTQQARMGKLRTADGIRSTAPEPATLPGRP